jgi:hypothetical protein
MTDDDWVRAALEDAVRDIEPAPALDLIRSRTGRQARRRRWVWGAAGAAVGVAATLTAVAVLTMPGDNTSGRIATPSPTSSAFVPVSMPVYFVSDTPKGPRLYKETARVDAENAVRAALDTALSGHANDPDYGSPFAGFDVTTTKAALENGQISIDLTAPASIATRPAGMTAKEAGMGVEQLVYTAQDALFVALGEKQSLQDAPVQFFVGGRPAYTLLGVNVQEPIAAAPRESTIAEVLITQPLDGATIPNGYTLKGYASAFEGTLQWELRQGDTVVNHGFATTTGGMGVYSEYATGLLNVPPGKYTLVVHGDDPSGGAAGPLVQDTKQITIK